MKILQINSHIHTGGAARIALSIHRQLLLQGEESYIAYGRGGTDTEENSFRFDTKAEILGSALFSRVSGLNGWGNPAATQRLKSYLDKIQPDLVHLHTAHGYYLNFRLLFEYINQRKIPCVWTFHDCHAFTGNCGYFFECEKWRTGCGSCPDIRRYPTSWFLDLTHYMWEKKKDWFTGDAPKMIVTPSEWLTDVARQSFFQKYPCITIRNGIDEKGIFYPRNRRQCREKYGYSQDEKIILGIAVGYSDPRKGARYIIQTAKDLEGEARVVLIGWEKKNDGLLKECSNIVTLPATESTEMLAEYYSLADIFVLPSLAENYATVSLESMACGTPVVGFDAGGIPEQLTGGRGIAVKAGDQQAFTDAVSRALESPDLLLRGENLAKLIRAENSVEAMTEKYLDVYKQLLRNAQR